MRTTAVSRFTKACGAPAFPAGVPAQPPIAPAESADDSQETAKTTRTGTTGTRNRNANDLYERLLTVQNAANLQWPERDSSNAAVRAEFRLGRFPPRGGSPPKPGPPNPPTPPA
ncbi:MAG: hypothetical protein HY298_21720 [Verrucomicrobia bacterium]|nr:hypothetical protein [Verrucomicrobiota bacterium]